MKKKVLIFCHGYNAPFIDVCNQYAAVFDRALYEVSVAYLVGKETAEVTAKTTADAVYFFDKAKRAVRGLKLGLIIQLLKLCRRQQFDIIICHRYKPAYIMALVALFIKIPKIFVVMHELGTLERRSRRFFMRYLAPKKITFAGVSNAVRLDLLQTAKFLKPAEVIVLANVIDVQQFVQQLLTSAQARQALGLAQNDFIFGNIGRLVKNKDQQTLLQSFAIVSAQFPQAKLVIMGQGDLAQALKTSAQHLKIADKVIFTGFVEQAFLYIKAFNVYISSSQQEAFGRVLLEAMVAEVPIIAAAVHGVPEVVADAGLLVPAKEPAALAGAMLETLNMPAAQLQALGEAGYGRVFTVFSIERFRALLLGLLS